MRQLYLAFCIAAGSLWISAVEAQYALGDGRALDHSLKVGERYNPVRDPFQNYRPYNPLQDGLGGQRFDDRWVRDGLRFAPEFQHGNSIYHRNLIFDYQGYSGWDLRAGRSPTDPPAKRWDDRSNLRDPYAPDKRLPTGPLDRSVRTPLLNSTDRIDTRVDTRATTTAPSEPPQRPMVRAVPVVPSIPEKLPPLYSVLSKEQIVTGIAKAFENRVQKFQIEKKIYGDIQEREISSEWLERNGLRTARGSMTLLGLTPEVRLQLQLEQLKVQELLKLASDYIQRALKADEEKPLVEKLEKSIEGFLQSLKTI